MKKQKVKRAAPAKKQANPKEPVHSFSTLHLREDALQQLPPEYRSAFLSDRKFTSAGEIEQFVLQNSKMLFGEHTFLIRKEKDSAGKNIPAPPLFLLDLSDMARPRFYLVDIAFAKDNFFGSTLPRITQYLFSLKNENLDMLWELTGGNKGIGKILKDKVSNDDIPAFLRDIFRNNLTILLITDDIIPELDAVQNTYGEWQRVRPMLLKTYLSNGHIIYTVSPPYAELDGKEKKVVKKEKVTVTEDDHLKDTSAEMREVYQTIKTELLKANSQLHFNSQKYYISVRNGRNIAIIQFTKSRMSVVVMNPEADTRKAMKHHEVKHLKDTIQKFWNGECCTIIIDGNKHLQEVTSLFKKMVTA